MLKAILLILILLACAGVGRALSNARKRRVELLAELLAAMRVLRLRMLNSAEPLAVLLRKSDSHIFQELGEGIWRGDELQLCWEGMRARNPKGLDGLLPADLRLLDSFFQRLGGSGRDEQGQLFRDTISAMEEAQTQARRSFAEAARVYTALGTLIGIGICVLVV